MVERHEIRNHLFTFFKDLIHQNKDTSRGYFTQWVNIRNYIIDKMGHENQNEIRLITRELLNEFTNNNLLMVGYGDEVQLPWFTVTEFGIKCIEEGNMLPFDPEGYITELQRINPDIDDVTLNYIKESITTYNKECLLSATITLGAASENILLRLIHAFGDSITDTAKKRAYMYKINNSGIYKCYKTFKDELKSIENTLSRELKQDYEVYLDTVFNFIRINRNKTGHPTGEELNKKVVYSNLQIFSEYSKKICDFIKYFKTFNAENGHGSK